MNWKDIGIGIAIEIIAFCVALESTINFNPIVILIAVGIFGVNGGSLLANKTFFPKEILVARDMGRRMRPKIPKGWDLKTSWFSAKQEEEGLWKIYIKCEEILNPSNWTNDFVIYDAKNKKISTKIFDNIAYWSKRSKSEKKWIDV